MCKEIKKVQKLVVKVVIFAIDKWDIQGYNNITLLNKTAVKLC